VAAEDERQILGRAPAERRCDRQDASHTAPSREFEGRDLITIAMPAKPWPVPRSTIIARLSFALDQCQLGRSQPGRGQQCQSRPGLYRPGQSQQCQSQTGLRLLPPGQSQRGHYQSGQSQQCLSQRDRAGVTRPRASRTRVKPDQSQLVQCQPGRRQPGQSLQPQGRARAPCGKHASVLMHGLTRPCRGLT
jgi:hypothetical protein